MKGRARGGWWLAAGLGILTAGAACGGGEPPAGGDAAAAATAPVDTAQGGRSAWVRRLGGLGVEQVWRSASGGDGAAVVTLIGDPDFTGRPPYDLGLVRLRADGSIAWSRQFTGLRSAEQLTWVSVAVTGMGNTFLSLHLECTAGESCMDFGAGQASGSLIVKFGPSGQLVWQRVIAADEGRSEVTVDGNGGPAVAVWRAMGGEAGGRRLVRYRWDGERLYDVRAPEVGGPGEIYPLAVGMDPAGNLAVGDGSAFYSLDGRGRLRWKAALPGGSVVSIGGTDLGTVVALVRFSGGTVSWGGTSSSAPEGVTGTFLAVAESNGAPRFGREIGVDDRAPIGAAVDPAGRVAILTEAAAGCERLEKWNLAGARLWTRSVSSCAPGVSCNTVSVDPVSHHVRVAGALSGTADLGTGPVSSRGGSMDGFVLDVRP